jgi:hypothetical protein
MLNSLRFAVAAVAAISFAGCLTHHYGDARLQENSDALTITTDRLYFKPVPLDGRATHILHARNLPLPIYPTHLLVPITPTEAERKQNFPWAKARLRVEFRALDGTAFFSKEVSLADAQPGRSPGTHHQLDLQFRPVERQSWKPSDKMPPHTSYDVVVTVLEPSMNKIHRATFYADTYVR